MNTIHLGHGRTFQAPAQAPAQSTPAPTRSPLVIRMREAAERERERRRQFEASLHRAGDRPAAKFGPGPLLSLAHNQCRWELRKGTFCGQETKLGTSWCPAHHKRVFEPAKRFREAAQ